MDRLDAVWTFIETGGPVMVPLVAVSIWMWHLIVLKALWLFRVHRHPFNISQALQCLDKASLDALPMESPRAKALGYFMQTRRFDPVSDRILWEVAVKRQIFPLKRHMSTLVVLAVVAPLLGLLGTVTGMVDTFRVIGVHGTGNPQAMASGIKEALITTQTGLMIAIPGLLAGQVLRRRISGLHGNLMIFYRSVDQWLERRQSHV
jgi:biopolymer transport protein ExbB